MKYLLDTDTITAIFTPTSPFFDTARSKIKNLSEQDTIYISILSFYELEFSLSNATNEEVKTEIKILINDLKKFFNILPLSLSGSECYGTLKANLKQKTGANRKALKKHNIDLMIASIALDNGCILVSKDRLYKEQLSISNEDFLTEDWTI